MRSQKAALAVALKPMFEEKAKERMSAGGGDRKSGVANLPDPIPEQARARDQAAAAVGVSGRIVQDAEHVKTHAWHPAGSAPGTGAHRILKFFIAGIPAHSKVVPCLCRPFWVFSRKMAQDGANGTFFQDD